MSKEFEHIKSLELSLLSADTRSAPEKLDRILADGFIEIGQSGRFYNKDDIIKELMGAPTSRARFFDFDIRILSDILILARYQSTNNGVTVARYSLWENNGLDWQILYHEAEAQNG